MFLSSAHWGNYMLDCSVVKWLLLYYYRNFKLPEVRFAIHIKAIDLKETLFYIFFLLKISKVFKEQNSRGSTIYI